MESKYDYVVFDIETTGLHPDSDQICEIAAIGVKDGLPQGTFSTLVAIEGAMPEAAGRVNGITDDDADDRPDGQRGEEAPRTHRRGRAPTRALRGRRVPRPQGRQDRRCHLGRLR